MFRPPTLTDRRSVLAGIGTASIALTIGARLRAAPTLSPIVAQRSKLLSRGLTASQWFEWTPGDPQAMATYLDKYRAADFAQIRSLGFDHVRVTLQPSFTAPKLWYGDPALDPRRLATLDEAMRRILDQDLGLILDCHPEKKIKDRMASDATFLSAMTEWWLHFAGHVTRSGQYPPDRVFLELLNEPESSLDDQAHYRKVLEQLASAARRGAPAHTIIAGGNRMNIAEALFQGPESAILGLGKPLADTNIIYTFHFYQPMEFTHQAMDNAGEPYSKLRGVPWDVDAGSLSDKDVARHDHAVQEVLRRYNEKPRRKNDLRWQFSELNKWCAKHGTFAWLGEFGVYDRAADPRQRADWIRDVRELAEEYGFGWCHYEARGGFGLFLPGDDRPLKVNASILAALGMTP